MEGETVGRSALSKASWRLLPLIGLGYGVAYMDRVNISFAAARMNADLHFSATVYGLGGGLFFLSYALFEVPSNLLLVRFGARRWIARIMFTWGVLAVGMMLVRTPLQFYAVRFALGVAEAGFFPGVIYYLGRWFPAAHRARAISRFYIAGPLSSVVMGALAGGLLGLQGRLGLAGWQWLFLVEGLPALAIGGVILWRLPDGPRDAPWLAPEETSWIETSLAADAAPGADDVEHGLLHAIASPMVLALGAVNFLMLGAFYAFTLSAPQVLDGATHLGATRVGFLIAAAGVVGAACMLLNAHSSDLRRERYLHVAVPLALMAAAFAVMSQMHAPAAAMAAYVTMIGANAATGGAFWLIAGEAIGARQAAASFAAINCIGQLGSAVAPYLWGLAKDATGHYQLGLTLLPIPFALGAAILLYLRVRDPRRAAAIALVS
jgi:MFS transporter, ACS family, tartrate transporter